MRIKHFIKTLTISSIVFISAQNVVHAKASEDSVIKLMEVTHINNLVQRASVENTLIIPRITQAMVIKSDTDLSKEQKDKLKIIVNDYMKKMLTDINTEQNKQQVANTYVKIATNNFTQAEVDAQLAFYGSDIGQSILKKNPKMMNEFMQIMMPNILTSGKKSFNVLLPQLEADVKIVLDK